MKVYKTYGLLSVLAMAAVCTSAFAQGGPPPQDDQNGPPPPMQGGRMGGPGGDMRRMGPPMEPLFMRPDVQKELKLTDDQIAKLQQLLPPPPMDGPGAGQDGMRGRQPDDRQGRQAPRDGGPGGRRGDPGMTPREGGPMGPDQMDGKLADILSDAQLKRLKELRLQREGGMSLMRREVANQIGLSDGERQRIRGMVDEAMESMRPEQAKDGPPDRKAMQEMHKKLSEEILGALTSKERSKLEELCGKPFKFDENWHPQRPRGGPEGADRRGDNDGPPPPSQDDGDL